MSSINSLGFSFSSGITNQNKNQKSANDSSEISSLLDGNSGADTQNSIPSSSQESSSSSSVTDQFMDYMKKSPAQRLRDDILQKMGLSEADLNSMSPDKRAAIEKEIADQIKKALAGNNNNGTGQQIGYTSSGAPLLSSEISNMFIQLHSA